LILSSKEKKLVIIEEVLSTDLPPCPDGDHPKDKPKTVQVQMSSKEVDVLVGYSEPCPPSPTRN